MILREQKISGCKALAAAGVDVSKDMAAEGLTAPEPPGKAAARADIVVAPPEPGLRFGLVG